MKLLKSIFTLLLVFITGFASAQIPKIGYVNSQKVLEQMPEYKVAQDQLEALASQMDSVYMKLISEYKKLTQEAADTGLSAVEVDFINYNIASAEQKIQQFEQYYQSRIDSKKAELFQPIIDKATVAIKAVASENGYTYVIDNTLNILVVMPDGDDITNLVKTKLGIQ